MKSIRKFQIFIFVVSLAVVTLLCGEIGYCGESVSFPSDFNGVVIDGEEFVDEAPPYVSGGVAYIPLTDNLAYALGGDLEYRTTSSGHLVAIYSSPAAVLVFSEGDSMFTVSDEQREMVGVPQAHGDYLAVPVKALFSALDGKVAWKNRTVYITRKPGMEVDRLIPGDFLLGQTPAEEIPQVEEPETPPEEPVPEEPAEEATPFMQEPDYTIAYTFENKSSYENISVSGDELSSNETPENEWKNDFNIRFMGVLEQGYDLNSTLRTTFTTDETQNQGEVKNFTIALTDPVTTVILYDLLPKFSKYGLRNYKMQGIQYSKDIKQFTLNGIWGRTPKKVRDSQYERYVLGWQVTKDFGTHAQVGIMYVQARDAGVQRNIARIDNKTYIATGELTRGDLEIATEVAGSETAENNGRHFPGIAKWVEVKYRKGDLAITNSYEKTGYDFFSETAFFTQGRREYSTLANYRIDRLNNIGIGYKSVRMLGEEREIVPIQLRSKPMPKRSNLRLTVKSNYEKARNSSGPRITDRRQFELRDQLGSNAVRFNWERRGQKARDGVKTYRTSRRYIVKSFLNEKLEMELQFKEEHRTSGSSRMNRYMKAKVLYELAEWRELTLTLDRYYNGTANDRAGATISYKFLDIFNDREISMDYRFQNYRDFNNSTLSLSYGFFR